MQQAWHAILLPQKPFHACCTADLGRYVLESIVNNIDETIHHIRRAISEVAEKYGSTTDDLVKFISVTDDASYNSVIDSFYLLEDTQIAKHYFLNSQFPQTECCLSPEC